MRDPARIDPILKKLEVLWKKYPDLRFCQLIDNIMHNTDIFYVEDTLFEKKLDKFIEKIESENK